MKREARLLCERAINSVLLAIEHFNRPSEVGRVEAVLIFLDHSFEMLLKAAIIEKGGKIRERGASQTIGFGKCVRVALTDGDIKFLVDEQALTLQTMNGLRDAAQHHIVDVSEGHLYVVAQASVTLFCDLLQNVFEISLHDRLPERVLPVSTCPPRDLTALFDSDMDDIRLLLAPGSRKEIAAKAKLRGLAIMEGAVNGENTQPSPSELNRLAKKIKEGRSWTDLFPGVASLALSTDGEGPMIQLRIKKKEGVPIRIIDEGENGGGVVAIKRVNELDFYTLSLQTLSQRVGVGRNKLLAVIKELGLQDDSDFFKEVTVGRVTSKLYSHLALKKLKEEIPGLDVEEIWQRRRPR
jgi:hypothetical protein